jgi:hypothetical protein
MASSSRIDHARRRLAAARVSIAVVAVAGFAAFSVAAKVSHPGSGGQASAATSSSTVAPASATGGGTDFFDSGSFGPSGSSVPQVQSGGS